MVYGPEDDTMNDLDDVYSLPGMLTSAEIDCSFSLDSSTKEAALLSNCSWKANSTVALARSTLLSLRTPSGEKR